MFYTSKKPNCYNMVLNTITFIYMLVRSDMIHLDWTSNSIGECSIVVHLHIPHTQYMLFCSMQMIYNIYL